MMATMHNYIAATSLLLALFTLSSCDKASQQISPQNNYSQTTTDSLQSSIIQADEIFASCETSIEFTDGMPSYDTLSTDSLCAEDKDVIQDFCSDMCRKWAKIYYGIEETGFGNFVQYESLGNYLEYSAAESTIECTSYGNDANFDLTTLEFDNGKAIAKGIYKDQNNAYGEYIFILVNDNGKILLNDLAINSKGSLDTAYRLDFIQAPYPDYWSNYSDFSDIVN